MLSTTSWTYTLKITISISILGLAIVALLAANPPSVQPVPWRMQMVSFIFGSLCILGVIAVFFPSMCSGMISPGREPENNERDISTRRYASIFGVKVVHGHHTLSKEFIDHEFQIGSKTFCAGCSGLLIGALVSVTGLFAYSTLNVEMRIVAPFLVGIGIVVIATVLLFPLLHKSSSIHRLLINATFVPAMLSILIGIDTIIESLEIDLYMISLSIFWMLNRIIISRFNHERIYSNREIKDEIKGKTLPVQ